MAIATFDVPVEPVAGAPLDASGFGFSKTIIASGDDGFDAVVEIGDGTPVGTILAWIPVAVIKGTSSVTVDCWGYFMRIRRTDGRLTPVQVTMRAEDSIHPLNLARAFNYVGGETRYSVATILEPITVAAYTVNPGETCDIVVLGETAGVVAPIAQLKNGQIATLALGQDYEFVTFKAVNSSGVDTVQCWHLFMGKEEAPVLINKVFALAALNVPGPGSDLNIRSESVVAAGQIAEITHPSPGEFFITYDEAIPPVPSGERGYPVVTWQQMDSTGAAFIEAVMIDNDTVRVHMKNLAGALVDPVPGQSFTLMIVQG